MRAKCVYVLYTRETLSCHQLQHVERTVAHTLRRIIQYTRPSLNKRMQVCGVLGRADVSDLPFMCVRQLCFRVSDSRDFVLQQEQQLDDDTPCGVLRFFFSFLLLFLPFPCFFFSNPLLAGSLVLAILVFFSAP